ncbi:iron complex outermembrane recepter protein [Chishuiella changwenlii]|uniref:Iron complex outermembrane recepter protein n=1 Tax=Chishuiella changwenlii TaxID=1434701 RepID=A0A1M7BRG6_9FLAO|nr:TonB-dependent receptor [Chishuiella changwenlii]GGF03357.1 TonB-dependent receptor [Chishuiella changwenlii]SHL57523.1 iron complex outermembrane recepter protein [Chishuiella changwenlii]
MKKKLILLLLLQITSQIHAQESENLELNETVVETTRIPEIVKNSSSSVIVVSKETIESLAMSNPDMSVILGLAVPSIGLSSNTTSNRSQTMRGRQMLIMIDGIPQSTPLRNTDRDIRSISPFAIERIEVIEGASSLYGSGAIGGVVNFVTKKNNTDRLFNGETSIGITDARFKQGDHAFGYKLNQQFYGKVNKFDYLVNGGIVTTGRGVDGERKFISPRYGLSDVMAKSIMAKVGYNFSTNTRIEAMYNYFSSEQDTDLIAAEGKYLQSPRIGIVGEKDVRAVNEGTRYNHNAYVKFISKDIFKNTNLDLSLYTQNLYTIFDYRANNPRSPRWEETGGQAAIKAEKYGARLNFLSALNLSKDIKMSVLYGGDFMLDETSQPLVDGRLWVPKLKAYNSAVFLQTVTNFYHKFSLKAGVRYDNILVKVPNYKTIPTRANQEWVSIEGGNLSYEKPTFNTLLQYHVAKEFNPYVSFSQGFAIFDLGRVLRTANADVVSKIETDPVATTNYEVGFTSKIAKKINLKFAYYWSHSKLGSDLAAGDDGFWKVVRNPQLIQGLEVQADTKINKYVFVGGSYSYLEGKLKSEGSSTYDDYMSGLSIPAPKLTLFTTITPVDNFTVNLMYTHTQERNRFHPVLNNSGNLVYKEGEGKVSPIDLFNLSSNYKMNNMRISLGIENLFNKTYYTSSSMLMARNNEYARGNGRYYTLGFTVNY